ncbi:RNA-directed DNA polymerase from mobile element jockey-like [Pitangus sulphuratus]|nr:RNA-directed DNA polymerase from mobile element jockey-like [Pitangus sulphuratus]
MTLFKCHVLKAQQQAIPNILEVKQARQKDGLAEKRSPSGVKSWESGKVPADWKLVNIVLIFKEGKRDDPEKYRPVSFNSVPGKIIDKIILGFIGKHTKDSAVIDPGQHRFMRGKFLINKFNFILRSNYPPSYQGKLIDGILLDFSKTFSTVSHSVLLEKLPIRQMEKYGWQPVTTGVLQGSTSCPVFFNILIDNIGAGLEVILSKFANNTKLGGAIDSLEGREAMQRDLEKSEGWAINNPMKFNEGKCLILHLAQGKPVHTD